MIETEGDISDVLGDTVQRAVEIGLIAEGAPLSLTHIHTSADITDMVG